jgi:hypothetical protein
MTVEATFYTVSDARFFPGTVALLNSLRLTGNRGELFVLDLGLESDQLALIEGHATVLEPPAGLHARQTLCKSYPHLLDPSGVIVIIDSDMIVTRPLDYELGLAAEGKICLFPDEPRARNRWFAEWEELFGLAAPPRRRTYRNAGFVAFSTEHWPELLERWWNANARILPELIHHKDNNPMWDADQDTLNAILMSETSEEDVPDLATEGVLPGDLLRTTLVDERSLACSLRGRPVSLMHYTGSPKPWEPGAWTRVRADPFVRLLRRLLNEEDVVLRVPMEAIPEWLRPTRRGRILLAVLNTVNRAARRASTALPEAVQDRLLRWRDAFHRRSTRFHEAR